ncbi:HNH endonuclease [Azospirillum rugosum]|uniref:HNH endonuclease n=1 Tax=Azospirillum rugosum TaxID=416170 RepID=A0ABS4SHX7_9PROT|nr:HNH endonuclease [Azospirillum rugosum]MBP2292070.1 hypothetical protein [Azospirillum rugosum]MDQ0525794.1 hypothetical protein [Azospirillum rugosum]
MPVPEPSLLPCPLCGRPMVPGPSLNEHHLVPRTYGGRATVTMHRICHAKIHAVLSEQELRDRYHTVESLRAHPEIASFLRWVARKPPEFMDGHASGRGKKKR